MFQLRPEKPTVRGIERPWRRRSALLSFALTFAYILIGTGLIIALAGEGGGELSVESVLGMTPWAFGKLMVGTAAVAMIWRLVLMLRYKPIESKPDHELPAITVVVPAYNEGQQVVRTLRSIVENNYPSDRLRVVAVNDGSQDDTWLWISRAMRRFPNKIIGINCTENRGKRRALEEGFKHSSGEILITADSDSELEVNALRNLVSPFVDDEGVGVVAGNVEVLNRKQGFFPRVMDFKLVHVFAYIRKSQSHHRAVLTAPGAFAAYRRKVVLKVLPEWVNETFLGFPVMASEDRAMTNLIIEQGYDSVYQSNAINRADMPEKFIPLIKMLLRWSRNGVRGAFKLAGFGFSNFRTGTKWPVRVEAILHLLRVFCTACFGPISLWMMITKVSNLSTTVLLASLLGFVVSTLLPATIYAVRRRSFEALWAFVYNTFFIICSVWIETVAVFTPHRAGWSNRDIKELKLASTSNLRHSPRTSGHA